MFKQTKSAAVVCVFVLAGMGLRGVSRRAYSGLLGDQMIRRPAIAFE
jgi:hypothetical protein